MTEPTTPRLLTGAQAAAYYGLKPGTFAQWVADGRAPKPLPGTRRWDRKALDLTLDKVSGIAAPASAVDEHEMAFEEWEAGYNAREAARARDQEGRKAAPTKRWSRRVPSSD